MTVTPLARLDLNLLVALRELIRERNVTRAAERLGVTQPAASASLRRLRRHFGDDLLVRRGTVYTLSPLAVQLADQVEALCAAVERVFDTPHSFDPSTSRREFSLVMADYTIAVLGGALARALASRAPRVRLHVLTVKEALTADVAQTLRVIDGLIAPSTRSLEAEGFRTAELFDDRWMCLVSKDNDTVGRRLSLATLARLEWVLPYHPGGESVSAAPATAQLAALGVQPRVAVRVDSYQAAAHLVAGTDRVALMQERLAVRIAPDLGLRVLTCPGRPRPIVEHLWWQPSFDEDPGHRWFREIVISAARALA